MKKNEATRVRLSPELKKRMETERKRMGIETISAFIRHAIVAFLNRRKYDNRRVDGQVEAL
jgi:predicted DNA-binding protein